MYPRSSSIILITVCLAASVQGNNQLKDSSDANQLLGQLLLNTMGQQLHQHQQVSPGADLKQTQSDPLGDQVRKSLIDKLVVDLTEKIQQEQERKNYDEKMYNKKHYKNFPGDMDAHKLFSKSDKYLGKAVKKHPYQIKKLVDNVQAEKDTLALVKRPERLVEIDQEIGQDIIGPPVKTHMASSSIWGKIEEAANPTPVRRPPSPSHTQAILGDGFGILKESMFSTNNHIGIKGVPKAGSDESF